MRFRPLPVALAILGAALIFSDLYLIAKNRELAAALGVKYAALQAAPGAAVPALRGKTLAGEDATFAWSGRKDHLLMVFEPGCGFCAENWPRWDFLLQRVDQSKLGLALVQLSGRASKRYLEAHEAGGVSFLAQVDPADVVPYKFRLVPQTILIGSDARVMRVWTGVLQPQDVEYILGRYAVRPGKEAASK